MPLPRINHSNSDVTWALLNALGFSREDMITELNIKFEAGKLTDITIHRYVTDTQIDNLSKVIESYNLVLQPQQETQEDF